jgi:hypothetical protein
MAILFQNPKKNTMYIITFLFIVVMSLFSWFVFRRISLKGFDDIIEESVVEKQEGIKIDFSAIETKFLDELEVFSPIIPTTEGYGRDNPFEPKEPEEAEEE